jgi:hypothetical protein
MKLFIVLNKNYGDEIKEEDMGGDITCMGGQKKMNDVLEIFIQVENTMILYQRFRNYRVHINHRSILQNHVFTNTEHKYMTLLPFEREVFAVL